MLVQLAQMASIAIENARLYEGAQQAERRVAFLAEASAILAASLDDEHPLQLVADLTVPGIADVCLVELLQEGGELRLAAVAAEAGLVESAREWRERFPARLGDERGAGAVVRSGVAESYAELDETLYPPGSGDPDDVQWVRDFAPRSAVVAPIRAKDRVLGAVTLLHAASGRRFSPSDVALAEDLGRRAALAIQTAAVYRDLSRFKNTVDTTLDQVFMFDPSTLRFFYVNQGAMDSVGYSREELLAMTPLDLKREFDERRFRALIQPLLDGTRPSLTFTTTHRRKDGSSFPVEVFLQFVAPSGDPGRMVAFVRDVTERVEARARLQRLAQSERAVSAELRAIIRAMGDAVLVFAADGSLILSNPAADALLAGVPIREYHDLLALLDEGEGELPRLGWHRPQGPVEVAMRGRELTWLEASAYPVLPPADALRGVDPSGPFETILLLRDVTQARVLRLARDTFIGVLSHELRTPVTTIYGNSKLLGSPDRNLAEEVREDVLNDIETEAERLYRLVEDLLVLARYSREDQTESRNEPLLLQRIVPSVLQSELRRWPLTRFEVDVDPGLPAVQGDRTYVEQVVRNLLSNAAKYSGEGTTVTVRLEDAEDEVRVRVLDQGPGFSPEDAERLFELFYRAAQTAARVSGAGIGLFVCKRLVEAMGGTIWARPRPEGGAEFGFTMNVFTEEGL